MKKKFFFPILMLASALASCNGSGSSSSGTSDSAGSSRASTTTTTSSNNSADTGNKNDNSGANSNTSTTSSSAPLDPADQAFVKKAAMGGKMEVDMGKMAQQNGVNDRVKNFGNMMVNDHSKANDELMQLVKSKNFNMTDSSSKKDQDHMMSMQKMKGKDFDKHYMSMMLDDHQKDVNEFEKASKTLKDPDLKNWATKTLPVLKTHLDSARAISKAKM